MRVKECEEVRSGPDVTRVQRCEMLNVENEEYRSALSAELTEHDFYCILSFILILLQSSKAVLHCVKGTKG